MSADTNTDRELSWSALQRLRFIEFRLLWDRQFNRGDLVSAFGISIPQATLDIREYIKRAPDNIDYNRSERRYFPPPGFKPAFISDSAEAYLSLLEMHQKDSAHNHPGLTGILPSFDVLPSPVRRVDSSILTELIGAINNKLSLEIHYQSMSSPAPGWRRVSPHSLVSDGLRWHVRAFCHSKKEFRDFVLGRIMGTRKQEQSEIDILDDQDWNQYLDVVIAPNPELNPDQIKIIERDYSMKNGEAEIRVRKAMLFYLERQLGIAESAFTPAAQQIVLSRCLPV